MSRCFITNLPLLQGQNFIGVEYQATLFIITRGGLEAVNGSDILQNVILLDQCKPLVLFPLKEILLRILAN